MMSRADARGQTERRKYYRINDVVMLRYEVVSSGTATEDAAGHSASTLEINTATLLSEIDRELNKSINGVWRDYPAVAQALGLLNRKISVLAAQALDYEENDAHSYDSAMVSLSGCGIAFEARQSLEAGTRLRLSVILKPSQIALSVYGTVVASEERLVSASMPYWVRVDFDEDVQAQEQIIQHVVQKQGALLSESASRTDKS